MNTVDTESKSRIMSRSCNGTDLDIEGIVKPLVMVDPSILSKIVKEMISTKIDTREQMLEFVNKQRKKHSVFVLYQQILYMYRYMNKTGEINCDKDYNVLLRSKSSRSTSGVQVVTILTSPYPETMKDGKLVKQEFSCEYDCKYCPKQPNFPRSYIEKEPAVLRAKHNKFDPVYQIWDRLNSYVANGMDADKIELIVLGGTWSSYPSDYQESFVRDCYYAANIYLDTDRQNNPRERKSLETEQKLNESAPCHIIGLTLETRPDRINKKELQEYRRFGVTRVQLGVQHTDDRVLYRVDRRCTSKHAINAIKMLKDNCFKVDIHLMPDLPQPLKEGISNKKDIDIDDIDTSIDMAELDEEMFDKINNDPAWQVDQIKVYPCEVVPWTDIKDWYEKGLYKPYGEQKNIKEWTRLFDVIIKFKTHVKPYVRLNRVVRDIPSEYISGGNLNVSARQTILDHMKKNKLKCKCMRCREIKNQKIDPSTAVLKIRKYEASNGTEYFLSYETDDENVLFGFLRLRLSKDNGMAKKSVVFPELINCAMIRELHVYGVVAKVDAKTSKDKSQHNGFGRKLLSTAYNIAKDNGYKKIAVISGVGVRNYYRKDGFVDGDNFLIKKLENKPNTKFGIYGVMILLVVIMIAWIYA